MYIAPEQDHSVLQLHYVYVHSFIALKVFSSIVYFCSGECEGGNNMSGNILSHCIMCHLSPDLFTLLWVVHFCVLIYYSSYLFIPVDVTLGTPLLSKVKEQLRWLGVSYMSWPLAIPVGMRDRFTQH